MNCIREHKSGFAWFIMILLLLFSVCMILTSSSTTLIYIYKLNAILCLLIGFVNIYEIRQGDSYSGTLLTTSLIYIEFVWIFVLLDENDVSKFVKAPEKNINSFLKYACFIFISLLIVWISYYFITKKDRKDKNIDETELKMTYLKSISQAVVIFFGVFSIATSGLREDPLLFAIYINTYLTFICPPLDLNIYVRQKELEQNEIDKHNTIVKPCVESKE